MLCSGLLPRGEDEVVEQHMKEQHRVFTNLPLVVGTSRLEVGQLEQFMGMVMELVMEVEEVCKQDNNKEDEPYTKESDGQIDMGIKPLDTEENSKLEPQRKSEEKYQEAPQIKRKHKKMTPKTAKVTITKIKDNLMYEPEWGDCVCPICPKEFKITDDDSEEDYKSHIYDHRVAHWNCNCGVAFEENILLKKLHIYILHRGQFHCHKCIRSFKEKDLFTEHMTRHNESEGISKYICDDCGFTTKTETLLSHHKAYKHDSKSVMCNVCSEKFRGRLKMLMHKRKVHVHGGKKQCPHCGDTFSMLQKHIMVMHTDDKKKLHPCTLCGKGFIERTRLNSHTRSAHTKEKPFPCRFLCGISCAEAGNRKKHEVTRYFNRIHICFINRIFIFRHGQEWT